MLKTCLRTKNRKKNIRGAIQSKEGAQETEEL